MALRRIIKASEVREYVFRRIGIMDQTIQNCIPQGPVSNKVMPALQGQLAGPVGVAMNRGVHFEWPLLAPYCFSIRNHDAD